MDSRRTNAVENSGTRSLVNPVDRTGTDRVSAQSPSSNELLVVLPGQLVGKFDFNTKKKRPAPKPPNHPPPSSEAGHGRPEETNDAVVRGSTDDAVTDARIVPLAKPRATLVRGNCDDEGSSKPLDRVPFETKSPNSVDEVSTRSECPVIGESSSTPKAAPRPLTRPTTQKLSVADSGQQDDPTGRENERPKPSSSTTGPEPGPQPSHADSRSSLKSSSAEATMITPFHPEDGVVSDESVSQQGGDGHVAGVTNLVKPKRKAPLRPPPKTTTRSSGKGISHVHS